MVWNRYVNVHLSAMLGSLSTRNTRKFFTLQHGVRLPTNHLLVQLVSSALISTMRYISLTV